MLIAPLKHSINFNNFKLGELSLFTIHTIFKYGGQQTTRTDSKKFWYILLWCCEIAEWVYVWFQPTSAATMNRFIRMSGFSLGISLKLGFNSIAVGPKLLNCCNTFWGNFGVGGKTSVCPRGSEDNTTQRSATVFSWSYFFTSIWISDLDLDVGVCDACCKINVAGFF